MPDDLSHQTPKLSDREHRQAIGEIFDLSEIASPRFARLAAYAHVQGLLALVLSNRAQEVRKRALELSLVPARRIHWEYPTTPPRIATPEEGVAALWGSLEFPAQTDTAGT